MKKASDIVASVTGWLVGCALVIGLITVPWAIVMWSVDTIISFMR